MILFFRKDERLFFSYIFAKSSRGNIEDDELKEFKRLAKRNLELTEIEIGVLVKSGQLKEIGGE
ncbi:MAG: type II toxin-antitoxin system RelE/ParE family toxin [Treponema sp.]|nr:type II toxin-antitoxin system RelE/ParE family toxin [Treponema sp.]